MSKKDCELAPVVTTKVEIGTEAVVAIGAHRVETAVRTGLETKKKEVKKANEDRAQAVKALEKALRKAAEGEVSSRLKAANEALRELGCMGVKLELSQVQLDEDKGVIHITVGANHYLTGTSTMAIPANVKALRDEAKAASDECLRLGEELSQLYEALDDIPSVERAMRAKIAEHNLSQTEEGRRLLEAVATGSVASLTRLPKALLPASAS